MLTSREFIDYVQNNDVNRRPGFEYADLRRLMTDCGVRFKARALPELGVTYRGYIAGKDARIMLFRLGLIRR